MANCTHQAGAIGGVQWQPVPFLSLLNDKQNNHKTELKHDSISTQKERVTQVLAKDS